MKLEMLLYLLAMMAGIACGSIIAAGWMEIGPKPVRTVTVDTRYPFGSREEEAA